jgi:hypothetical protein
VFCNGLYLSLNRAGVDKTRPFGRGLAFHYGKNAGRLFIQGRRLKASLQKFNQ